MAKSFKLYGILDTNKNELVKYITNPKHRYWERKKCAENSLASYLARPKNTNVTNLKVVEITCTVKD